MQRSPRRARSGAILPLAVVCLTLVLSFCAFTFDIGYLCLTKGDAQNCADGAALAAALEMFPTTVPQTALQLPLQLPIYQPVRPSLQLAAATAAAHEAVGWNAIADRINPDLLTADLRFGIYHNGVLVGPPGTLPLVDGLLQLLQLRTPDQTFVNACTVTVRRDALANGRVNLFFSPALGVKDHAVVAQATAVIERGYGLAAGDKMLPFAMDITVWNALRFTNSELNAVTLKPLGVDLNSVSLSQLLGGSSLLGLLDGLLPLALSGSPINVLDGKTWRHGMHHVTSGPDGVIEAVLLADQLQTVTKLGILGGLLSSVVRIPSLIVSLETGLSGSVPNAVRMNQVIRHGLSADDVARISGDQSGLAWLPFSMKGYFEVPTACEADLKAIIGQPRIMPLYATLPGTVNKVTDVLGMPHTIQFVGWGAVVITEVNLTGPIRYINVQPAVYARHSIRPAAGSQEWRSRAVMSDGVYTAPRLVH